MGNVVRTSLTGSAVETCAFEKQSCLFFEIHKSSLSHCFQLDADVDYNPLFLMDYAIRSSLRAVLCLLQSSGLVFCGNAIFGISLIIPREKEITYHQNICLAVLICRFMLSSVFGNSRSIAEMLVYSSCYLQHVDCFRSEDPNPVYR